MEPKIEKVTFDGDTYDIKCSCSDCDWVLFPTAWLKPEEVEDKTFF